MKKICVTLGKVVLILCIIGYIALVWKNGVVIDYGISFKTDEQRNFLLIILWITGGMLLTTIESVFIFAFGEILEN